MLNSGASFLFFAVFALILVAMYLAVRREWASTGAIGIIGVLASVTAMMMVSLSEGNSIFQALIVSIGMGAVFSLSTLAIAMFFHSNELRDSRRSDEFSQTIGDTE